MLSHLTRYAAQAAQGLTKITSHLVRDIKMLLEFLDSAMLSLILAFRCRIAGRRIDIYEFARKKDAGRDSERKMFVALCNEHPKRDRRYRDTAVTEICSDN